MNIVIIPLISSAVSLVFAVTVQDQFFGRRKPYQLNLGSRFVHVLYQ